MNEDIDIPERRRQEIKRYLDLTRRLWDEAERLGMQKYRDTTPESPDWQDALKLQREWEESKAYKAWHKNIHLQPRTPIECYFAKAEDQATWRKHLETKNAALMPLEGKVKDLEKERDRLQPHAERGKKILKAAKKGAERTRKRKTERQEAFLKTFARAERDFPKYTRQGQIDEAIRRLKRRGITISRSTAWKYLKNPEVKNSEG